MSNEADDLWGYPEPLPPPRRRAERTANDETEAAATGQQFPEHLNSGPFEQTNPEAPWGTGPADHLNPYGESASADPQTYPSERYESRQQDLSHTDPTEIPQFQRRLQPEPELPHMDSPQMPRLQGRPPAEQRRLSEYQVDGRRNSEGMPRRPEAHSRAEPESPFGYDANYAETPQTHSLGRSDGLLPRQQVRHVASDTDHWGTEATGFARDEQNVGAPQNFGEPSDRYERGFDQTFGQPFDQTRDRPFDQTATRQDRGARHFEPETARDGRTHMGAALADDQHLGYGGSDTFGPDDDGFGGEPLGSASDDFLDIEQELAAGETQKNLIEWAVVLVAAILLALIVRAFLFQAFEIPSPSMESTLEVNDRVLVNKTSYVFGDITIGDIVVFERTEQEILENPNDPEHIIKRVVAVGGDTIEFRNNVLIINGEPYSEPYLDEGTTTNDFGPKQVPEGHIFVMGDNRGGSNDSRQFGFVSEERVIGRAFFLYWPPGRVGTL